MMIISGERTTKIVHNIFDQNLLQIQSANELEREVGKGGGMLYRIKDSDLLSVRDLLDQMCILHHRMTRLGEGPTY